MTPSVFYRSPRNMARGGLPSAFPSHFSHGGPSYHILTLPLSFRRNSFSIGKSDPLSEWRRRVAGLNIFSSCVLIPKPFCTISGRLQNRSWRAAWILLSSPHREDAAPSFQTPARVVELIRFAPCLFFETEIRAFFPFLNPFEGPLAPLLSQVILFLCSLFQLSQSGVTTAAPEAPSPGYNSIFLACSTPLSPPP